MKKQILLINDVAGNSKVGMGAMIPVLSYMGFPTFNLPTALVSNTFDYGRFALQDTTDFIRQTLPVWKELGFSHDAICTGCMFTDEQVHLVADYCREQHRQGTQVFVDPVMGDGGRLYNGMTMKQVELMRQMVSVADLTFPNYTEAALLTGMTFRPEGLTWDEARQLLDAVRQIGARSVLVTSCRCEGRNCVVGYNAEKNDYFRLEYEEIPGIFQATSLQPSSSGAYSTASRCTKALATRWIRSISSSASTATWPTKTAESSSSSSSHCSTSRTFQ